MNRAQRRKAERRVVKAAVGYQHRILAATPELMTLRGQVSRVMIAHDSWCAIYQRRPCSCVPDISVDPIDGVSVLLIDEHGRVSRVLKQ